MSSPDIARALILAFCGLALLVDAVLAFSHPAAMWSYASHRDYLLRALLLALWFGFGLHLAYEWRG